MERFQLSLKFYMIVKNIMSAKQITVFITQKSLEYLKLALSFLSGHVEKQRKEYI